MTERTRELLKQALSLSRGERAEIAAELLSSIEDEAERGSDEAWEAEIERRANRVVTGESAGLDWDQVKREIERDILGR